MTHSSEKTSLVGGHAHYVKGIIEEGLGTLGGSTGYAELGTQHKEEAVAQMKEAAHAREAPSTDSVQGKLEDSLGKAAGCEGVQDKETSETQTGQEDRYATTHGEH